MNLGDEGLVKAKYFGVTGGVADMDLNVVLWVIVIGNEFLTIYGHYFNYKCGYF